MATKLNRKFTLVVVGFGIASAVLLTGVIVVYNTYVKNAERHIVAGDALMAQGKYKEAYEKYGAAVSRNKDEVRYIAKMEEALQKVVASTSTQAKEDYARLRALKEQRTRAQPRDPAQWKMLLEFIEDDARLSGNKTDWARIAERAKEMKDAVPAGTPGAEIADVYMAIGRARQGSTLSAKDRAELAATLSALTASQPKDWRLWTALYDLQLSDAEQASRSGQASEASQRMAQVDATVKGADAALAGAGPDAAAALARMKLVRLTLDGATGRRVPFNKIDPLAVGAALDALQKTALDGADGNAVREAAALFETANQLKRAVDLLDEYVAKHPNDPRTRTIAVVMRGRLAQSDPTQLEALRAAAKSLVDLPQLPTGLDAALQEEFRSLALGSLLDAELARIKGLPEAERAKNMEGIAGLRAQLLLAAQNQDSKPAVLAADAKIAQIKGDFPEAQRKWDAFFAKVPSPQPDSYEWAIATARARKENGVALQLAIKGSEAHPTDLPLMIERTQLSLELGRIAEAQQLVDELVALAPENAQLRELQEQIKRRVDTIGGKSSAPTEMENIQRLVGAKDFNGARAIVDRLEKERGPAPQFEYLRSLIASSEGNTALADQLLDAGLQKYPESVDLWKLKAERTSTDRIEQVDIMLDGVIKDPARRAAERLNAYRQLRFEMVKKESQLRGPDPQAADKVKADIARLVAKIEVAEKEALASGAGDPAVVENAFGEALGEYQQAMQEGRQNDAQAAGAQMAQLLETARKIPSAPELPIVLESLMLEVQGKFPEALAMVEKARADGRTEARVLVRIATLRERVGNEPGAAEAWEEAYKRRPNDAAAVIGYARALGRSGKAVQGIQILRAAWEAAPSDSRFALMLAQVEAGYGSRARAIAVREELSERLRPIPENVVGLYSLLYMPPSFDALKGANGQPMSSSAWGALSAEQRGRLLSDKAREYQERAEAIYREALAANPLDIGFAVQKARVMREQGRADEGARAIMAVIESARAKGAIPSGMYLDLGLHYLASNKPELAEQSFAEARKLQDPTRREADQALVEIEVQRGNIDKAAKALEEYAKTNPRVEVQLRLCELEIGAGNLDAAQAALDKARSMAGASPSKPLQASFDLLAAGIDAARGEQADRSGNIAKGKEFRERALTALSRADALQPDAMTAAVRRVGVLRIQAKSGGRIDPEFYDRAVAEADRLISRNASVYDAAALRAGLALDRGDKQGAINVLDRFVTAVPMHDAARSRLIQLYMETGNLTKAVAIARGAVDLAPTRADWRERLGDLLSLSGDRVGAAESYERAYLVQPEIYSLLAKAMDERTAAGKPDIALAMQQNAGTEASTNAVVRAAQAVALNKQGRTAEAQAVAREAILAARAAGIKSPLMEQVLPRIRNMYPKDKLQDVVDLIVSTGSPNTAEKVLIASMWGELGPSHADELLKWADSALADGTEVPPTLRAMALTARGNVLYVKKDMANAIKSYQQAAELEPQNATALNNAAYLAADSDQDLDLCRKFAEAAVALSPETPEFLDTLAYVMTKLGVKNKDARMLELAEGILQRAQMMSESASVSYHLGMAQAANGRTADALRSYEKAAKQAAAAANKDEELIKRIEAARTALK